MNKKLIGLIVAILLMAAFNPFGNNSEVHDEFEVGLILSLSDSPVTSISEDFLRGFELGYEELGSEYVYYVQDNLGTAAGAVSAANNLFAREDVDVLVSLASAIVMPLVDVAESHKVPFLGSAVARDDFATNSEYTFKMYPNSSVEAKLAAEFAERKGYERVGVLTVSNAFGNTFNEVFEKEFDGEIVINEEFMVPEKDYRLFLSKVKDLDMIYFVGFEFHNALFLKQRAEMGLDIPVLSTTHIRSNAVKDQAPIELYKDVYATTPEAVLSNKENQEFHKKFEEKYGIKTDWNAASGYDTALVLHEVSQMKEKDTLEALAEIDVAGLQGHIDFDRWGQFDIELVVIDAGTDEIVYR